MEAAVLCAGGGELPLAAVGCDWALNEQDLNRHGGWKEGITGRVRGSEGGRDEQD